MHNLSTNLSNLQTEITPQLMQQWINKPETKYVHWVESKSLNSLSRLIRLAATVQWLNKYWKNSFQDSALSEYTPEHFVRFITCLATQYHQILRTSAPISHNLDLEFLAGLNDFLRKYIPESTFRNYEDESADSKSGGSSFYPLIARIMRQGNFKAQPLVDIFRALYNRELFSNIDLGKSFSVLATLAQKKFLEGKIDNLTWVAYEASATGPHSVAKLLTNYSAFAEGGHLQQVFKIEVINELLSAFKVGPRSYLSINQVSNVVYSLNNLVKHSALDNIVNLDVDSLSVLLTSLKNSPAKATQLDKLSAFLFQLMNRVNSSSDYPRMLTMSSLLTLINLATNVADDKDCASCIVLLLNTGKIIQSEEYKQSELETLRSKTLPLFGKILKKIPQLTCKEIANILYSAVLLGVQLTELEIEKLVKRFQQQQALLTSKVRAVLAHKMAQYLYFNRLAIPPLFLKWIRERKPEPTKLQKKVFSALKSQLPADYKVEMEALVGIWPVDILITYGDRKYVLEIDGSTHEWHGQLRIQDRMRDNAFKIRENVILVKRVPVSSLRLKFTAIMKQISANISEQFNAPVPVDIKSTTKISVTKPLTTEDSLPPAPVTTVLLTAPEINEVKKVTVKEKPAKKTESLPTPNKKLSPLKNLSNRLSQKADLKEIGALARKIIPGSITGGEATQLLAKGLIYDQQARKKDSSTISSVFTLILELTETDSYLKPFSKTECCALEKAILDNNPGAVEAVISLITPSQKKSKKNQKTMAASKLPLPSGWRAAVQKALELSRDNIIAVLNRSFNNVSVTEKKPQTSPVLLPLTKLPLSAISKDHQLTVTRAQQGHAPSQFLMGWEYLLRAEKHKKEAGLILLKSSANKNYAPALRLLGMLYERGDLIHKNLEKAYRNYRRGAELGDAECQASHKRLAHLKELKYAPLDYDEGDALTQFNDGESPKLKSSQDENPQMITDLSGSKSAPESFAEAATVTPTFDEFPEQKSPPSESHPIETDFSGQFSSGTLLEPDAFEQPTFVESLQPEVCELKAPETFMGGDDLSQFTFDESATIVEGATSISPEICHQPYPEKIPFARQIKTVGGSPIMGKSGDHRIITETFSMTLS